MADENTATDDTSAGQQQPADDAQASNEPAPTEGTGETSQTVEGAPESYESFTMPEGVQMNDELLGEFSQLAKDANLPQDKAQSMVELGAKMAKGFESKAQESLENLKTEFADSLAKDPDLGGENMDANLAVAQRAINAYGSKDLNDMLVESGLNKHPELVRFFHAVGKTIAEDTNVDGSVQTTSSGKSLAERMYGESNAA